MSKPETLNQKLICKPTKWFLWRALAMLLMFSVFAVLFLKDGIWGYKKKNLHFYYKANFDQAGTDFQDRQNAGTISETNWKNYASNQKIKFPEDATSVLPEGTDLDQKWPEVLVEGFSIMNEKGGQTGAQKIWENYTKEKGWDAEVVEKAYTESKIEVQFIAAAISGVLVAITLFFLIRTMRRTISVDDTALYTQDGRTIPFTNMVRIDKRKWDTKGIAIVHYKDGNEEKTAKIDGLVYGQFREEDGAPAEKLFSHLMENFKGEVIEYAEEEEDEEENSEEK